VSLLRGIVTTPRARAWRLYISDQTVKSALPVRDAGRRTGVNLVPRDLRQLSFLTRGQGRGDVR
jgi:hypothetical protein